MSARMVHGADLSALAWKQLTLFRVSAEGFPAWLKEALAF